jgi:hypothetical protein
MDAFILAQNFNKAQYADGVFIRLTGGTVHEFHPWTKVDGYLDAATMTPDQIEYWLDYCVNTLGYVYNGNGKGAGHVN